MYVCIYTYVCMYICIVSHVNIHTPETAYVSIEVASSKSRIVKTPVDAYSLCMYVCMSHKISMD